MRIWLIVAIFMLPACASQVGQKQLGNDSASSLDRIHVYNFVEQEEIHPPSNVTSISALGLGLGGVVIGAIGVAVDSTVEEGLNKSLYAAIEPFYGATDDYDFRREAAGYVDEDIARQYRLSVSDIQVIQLTTDALIEEIDRLDEGESLLYIITSYQFGHDFHYVNAHADVRLYNRRSADNRGNLLRQPIPIYRNNFFYQSQIVGSGGKHSLDLWMDNDGTLYRSTMADSMQAIGKALAYDMRPGLDERCLRKVLVRYGNSVNPDIIVDGKIISDKDGRRIVRRASGGIYVVHNEMSYQHTKRAKRGC